MANGDITSIKELGRYTIPGGGFTTAGAANNNKVVTWGEIKASYASTGINLTAKGGALALGVSNIDFADLTVRLSGSTGTVVPTDNNLFLANMNATWKIFVVDQEGQANPAVPTAGDLITINYLVVGDDTRTVNLA